MHNAAQQKKKFKKPKMPKSINHYAAEGSEIGIDLLVDC